MHNGCQKFLMLALICLAYLLTPLHRIAPAVMAEPIMQEVSLSPSMLGLLSSMVFLTFGIMQIPDGILADRYNPGFLLSGFLCVCALGSFVFARAESIAALLWGRALIGFGMSMIFIGGIKLFSLYFPLSWYGRLNGLLLGMGGLGMILGTGAMAYLVTETGWRETNFGIGVATLAFAALIPFSIGKRKKEAAKQEKPPVIKTCLRILRNRQFILIAIWFCCQFSLQNAFGGLWSGEYLRQARGLSTIETGNLLNMLGMGTLAGALINPWWTEKFFHNPKPVMLVSAAVDILLFGSLLWFGEQFSFFTLGIWFFLLAFFGMGALFAGFASLPALFGTEVSGTASGLLNAFPQIFVLALQYFTGVILEICGGVKAVYASSEFMTAFVPYLAASLVSFFCAIAIVRNKPQQTG